MKNKTIWKPIFLIVFITTLFVNQAFGQQILAFPEADGFGKYTTGGRGGIVIEVTNLNDNGAGSLRAAVTQSGPRIIVFRVSGTIYLLSRLNINKNDVTIAGQTAPGCGITIANYNVNVNADNVIIRYIRCRLGDNYKQADDAFTCTEHKNIIIDHCSFGWSLDEAASCYLNENFTMQWCLISESLYNSFHPKGAHGYGGIWGGNKASFHHNMFAHNTSRNPRFNGARYAAGWNEQVDFRNNVIYNWGFNSSYAGEPSEMDGNKAYINIVKNYYKPGPATSKGPVSYRILEPYNQPLNNWGYSYFYIDSNYMVGSPQATIDNWQYGVQNVTESDKIAMKSTIPFGYLISSDDSAEGAYNLVIKKAGANIPRRDMIDKRVLWEVINDTATYGASFGINTGIIDSQNDVGGYPEIFSYFPPIDTDRDGMPDDWETQHGLDPSNPVDRNNNINGDGYTALEVYLNNIGEFKDFLLPPTNLKGKLLEPKVIKLTWTDNSENETGFVLEKKQALGFEIIDTIEKDTSTYIDSAVSARTNYTYRLRAISSTDSSVYSNEIFILTPSASGKALPASNLFPDSNSVNQKVFIKLSWKAGLGTQSHNIYFDTINPPKYVKTSTDTFYSPGILTHNTKYYWRIDEANDFDTTSGTVWNFVTRASIPEKLVGHWTFDTPMKAEDSSEFGNNGILERITASSYIDSGAIGKSIYFNGRDQYIYVSNSNVFDFDINSFTITFWLKMDPESVDPLKSYRFVVKGSNVLNPALGHSGKRYEVYYTPSKSIFRFAVDDDINKSEVTADESFFIKGKWVFVVAIRDTTEKLIKLFADTVKVNEIADITGDISQNEDLYFSYCVDESSFLQGALDDVRLYSYALPKNKIDSLFQLSSSKPHVIENVSNKSNISFTVYPNPFKNHFSISFNLEQNASVSIYLTDIFGRKVATIVDNNYFFMGNHIVKYHDTNALKNGTYILNIKKDNSTIMKKLLIID